jgi:hypothetical protein
MYSHFRRYRALVSALYLLIGSGRVENLISLHACWFSFQLGMRTLDCVISKLTRIQQKRQEVIALLHVDSTMFNRDTPV